MRKEIIVGGIYFCMILPLLLHFKVTTLGDFYVHTLACWGAASIASFFVDIFTEK